MRLGYTRFQIVWEAIGALLLGLLLFHLTAHMAQAQPLAAAFLPAALAVSFGSIAHFVVRMIRIGRTQF